MVIIQNRCPRVSVGEQHGDTADHIKVFQCGHDDGAAFIASEIPRQDRQSVLGSFVMEAGFHHSVGVFLQCAVDGHPFEREVLLGEEVACEHEAGDEKGKVFFHENKGLILFM